MVDLDPPSIARPRPRIGFAVLASLAAIVVAALWLRLDGLGERALSHPENFAPGIDMPSWVRFPPKRDDLASVLRGTLIDGHPPTYFVALLPWTDAFGSSLTTLRLPSALLGALTIALAFAVALREGSRLAALLAAGLLALHGHHVYWSQMARMYVPAAFLALLSTWFMLRLRERGRAADRWAFFASTTFALSMQLYAWPLVFAQMVGALLLDVRDRRAPTALRTQLSAVVASLWVVQLAIYQNPPTRWNGSASEYLQLGYLFESSAPFFGERPDAALARPYLLALGIALLVVGAVARRRPTIASRAADGGEPSSLPGWFELCVVAGSTAAMAAFALLAPPRERSDPAVLWALCFAPALIALAHHALAGRVARIARDPPAWLGRVAAADVPLSWQLAIVPAACMAMVSITRGVLVPRGTILFLPFLTIAVAHALVGLFRVRPIGVAALAAVLALYASSVRYFADAQSGPRDYVTLARELRAELRPTDLVLVRDNYSYPPLLYYLGDAHVQCVPDKQPERLRKAPRDARIWLVEFVGDRTAGTLRELVADRRATRTLEVVGARAVLHESL